MPSSLPEVDNMDDNTEPQEHTFILHNYYRPVYCAVCTKVLWGFSSQGMQCSKCMIDAHEHCLRQVPQCLGDDAVVAFPCVDEADESDNIQLDICMVSCSNLAKKYMLHHPDPFAILVVEGNKYRSPVAKKTFNPTWASKHTITTKLSSTLVVSVFDNKRFKSIDSSGAFLGVVAIPVCDLIEKDLAAGVTVAYRLRKRNKSDAVTGLFVMSCKYTNQARDEPLAAQYMRTLHAERARRLTHPTFNPDDAKYIGEVDFHSGIESNTFGNSTPDFKPNAQLRSYGDEARKVSLHVKLDLPTLPESAGMHSIIPKTPSVPTVTPDTDHSLLIEWGSSNDIQIEGKGKQEIDKDKAVVYKLFIDGGCEDKAAKLDEDESDVENLEYVGSDVLHKAVALKTGWYYRFRLQATNNYGHSKPSRWSDAVRVRTLKPQTPPPPPPKEEVVTVVDDRPHCPFYMSGYCRYGNNCQFSHGTGIQDDDDLAAAMLGAALNQDHHAGIALALAKSLVESQGVVVDTTELSQIKRDLYKKRQQLSTMLPKGKGECHLTVYRTQLFASSNAEVMHRSAKELKKQLFVHFHGEGGVDYGGLAREWLFLLSHELFSCRRGFFEFSDDQTYLLQIANNRKRLNDMAETATESVTVRTSSSSVTSEMIDDHVAEDDKSTSADHAGSSERDSSMESKVPNKLSTSKNRTSKDSKKCVAKETDILKYYNFIGRVMGLSVFHHHFLDAVFVRTFYKYLLKQKPTLADLENVDAALHRSLLWILENDVDGVLDLNFSVDAMIEDELITVDLKPGGADIDVTDENKEEYVSLFLEWRVNRGTDKQMQALSEGFHEFVPVDVLLEFTPEDLELLMSGEINIDVDDWKANTTYKDTDVDDDIVKWFWKIVEESNRDLCLRILQFVTGTQRIPTEGFQALQGTDGPRRFCIQKTGDVNNLPTSHTCFNRLDLPPYADFEIFQTKLITAVQNFQGFNGE
eukprot:CFRG6842T1